MPRLERHTDTKIKLHKIIGIAVIVKVVALKSTRMEQLIKVIDQNPLICPRKLRVFKLEGSIQPEYEETHVKT